MTPLPHLDAVLFDVGDTLVEAAPPGTAVADLQVRLRPDVLRDLRALAGAGLRLGAVTDTAVMAETDVRALLAPSGLSELLEVVVTSVDVGAAKPDPTSLSTALGRLGVAPTGALLIGDRVVDRDAARAAGTGFAFVGATVAATIERWAADPLGAFGRAVQGLRRTDAAAASAARARLDALAKPVGSLGRLEDLAVRLAGIAGRTPHPLRRPVVAVFAADHGVHDQGVTPWPRAITAAMTDAIADGRASINAIASSVGADVVAVDVGVADGGPRHPAVLDRRIRAGTRDLALGPAMTLAEATAALDAGAALAAELVADGADALVTGDMGIANTTASAALVAALTGRHPADVTGRGTGVDDATLAAKRDLVARAVGRPRPDDPLEVLADLGGLEIAAIAGFVVGGAATGVPVVVDGLIALAGLLAAERLAPGAVDRAVAGHRSVEPGATAALDALHLEPLLDLDLRLGEGTGACLALPLLAAAARLLTDVATIDDLTGPPPS